MNDDQRKHGPFFYWAQLVRLPNVFTVVADVSAGFLLVSQGPEPLLAWLLVVLAGVAFYWAGMILNDVFDLEIDRVERPNRPLPAGNICSIRARWIGWALLAIGILLGTLSGMLPNQTHPTTWLPAILSVVLAAAVYAYNGPLKNTPLAPSTMGFCRMLSFLLGTAPVLILPHMSGEPFRDQYIIAIALGLGLYIMGITLMARDEATSPNIAAEQSPNLKVGLVVMVIGAGVLAFAPRTALPDIQKTWYLSASRHFPFLIGMIVYPIVLRAYRCLRRPTPERIQMMIRSGILTIIPFSAAIAMLAAGPIWGLAIFTLIVPAFLLSAKLRMT
ncbi:prenyltransferase [Novipirellula aureliae]|uniref:Prenyltransferase n=1 Tax=Novipirellula aureliae TaxID=2527966 RepID=A0A5C6DW66_9BACT|nr:prenyltransferase [Novipirellula aureliae]